MRIGSTQNTNRPIPPAHATGTVKLEAARENARERLLPKCSSKSKTSLDPLRSMPCPRCGNAEGSKTL